MPRHTNGTLLSCSVETFFLFACYAYTVNTIILNYTLFSSSCFQGATQSTKRKQFSRLTHLEVRYSAAEYPCTIIVGKQESRIRVYLGGRGPYKCVSLSFRSLHTMQSYGG